MEKFYLSLVKGSVEVIFIVRPFYYTETLQKESALLLTVYGVSTSELHFNFFSSGMRS